MPEPRNKQCWFCGEEKGDEMFFSHEFDTWVHFACLGEALQKENTRYEAEIMANEVGLRID